MVHGTLFIAAEQALNARADVAGAPAVVAVVVLLLGVVAMFGLLFKTNWASPGGDPTDDLEQQRRHRLNQNPAYTT